MGSKEGGIFTQFDRIRNERKRGSESEENSNKVKESRLKWYVHCWQRKEHYVERRAMKLELNIKRGRHGTSYLNRVRDDIRFI